MRIKKLSLFAVVGVVLVASGAYAALGNTKEAVVFYKGHSHEHGETVGAPEHSGGTDKYGCHNASVPYHCH